MNEIGKSLTIFGLLIAAAGALVGNWQRLARQTARGHSLHQRQFQFLFSDRHVHPDKSDFDVHSLALPQVTFELPNYSFFNSAVSSAKSTLIFCARSSR
jgi:hypothetical protein